MTRVRAPGWWIWPIRSAGTCRTAASEKLTVGELAVPADPGTCTFADNTLVNRMNRTQASIYHLGKAAPALPDFSGYTDVSESTVFVALFGPRAFRVAEKLTNLDFSGYSQTGAFSAAGPFLPRALSDRYPGKNGGRQRRFFTDLQPGVRRQHAARHPGGRRRIRTEAGRREPLQTPGYKNCKDNLNFYY